MINPNKNNNMASFTPKQREAIDLAMSGHNIYIGGQAGTGKTFVVNRIFDKLSKQGKKVHLTCTTGIACSSFKSKAKTIHSWAGIDDGRHDISFLKILMMHHRKDVVKRVNETDVLILDEVSMLSEKTFDQIEEVCSLKNDKYLFGGIQVILSGDFYQLPPVKNLLYRDPGTFCFQSKNFDKAFPHKVILTDVIRQTDSDFVQTVNEVSRGYITQKSMDLLGSLQRPLPNQETVKLFSSNELVDSFNRTQLLSMPDNVKLYEYIGEDSGNKKYLQRILAPRILWVKVGCPVMLLRNISDTLINGLRGTVVDASDDGPVVNFPESNVTIRLKKQAFSVFSPVLKQNVAQRVQYPIKLAFSMTVHKAQGMTIDRLEVDCQQMFAPGQLGVAIGRVRSPSGLRIVNFKKEVCLPQPAVIQEFLQLPSQPAFNDKSCCHVQRPVSPKETPVKLTSHESSVISVEEDDFDEEEDIDNILVNLKDTSSSEEEALSIPEDFDIEKALINLKYDVPLNSLQENTNKVIDLLIERMDAVKKFCCDEFNTAATLMNQLEIDDSDPKPVVAEKLSKFYKECKLYSTTTEYRARIELMFFDIQQEDLISQQLKSHISYNLVVEVRRFLLAKKECLYDIHNRNIFQRTLTSNSDGKIRYVAGYCIASLRQHYKSIRNSNCFKSGSEDQVKYDSAVIKMDILGGFCIHEHALELNTEFPESLIETASRQNITRGLTNIQDRLFKFFLSLCEKCLSLLIEKNLNIHGEAIFKHCMQAIENNVNLYEDFLSCVNTIGALGKSVDEPEIGIMEDLLQKICSLEELFIEISGKFLKIMLSQFLKDFLRSLSVQKKVSSPKRDSYFTEEIRRSESGLSVHSDRYISWKDPFTQHVEELHIKKSKYI